MRIATRQQLEALYGTGEYLAKKYETVSDGLIEGDIEAGELLNLAAMREREFGVERKHPVYELATLIISRWEYKDGNSDIIEYTTFTVWKHGDSVGDIDPSYNDIKAHEFALAKASSEGWRICSEVMHISEKREYLTHVYTLQREKL